MELCENLEPDLCPSDSSLFYVYRFYLAIDSLKELLPYRFDERYILQQNFEKLSVLVIVILLVVWLDLDLTPLREGYPLNHDLKDVENFLSHACRKLIKHLVVRLNPRSQKVDHWPADLHAVSVEDVDGFLEEEVKNLVVVLSALRGFERVSLAADGLLHG